MQNLAKVTENLKNRTIAFWEWFQSIAEDLKLNPTRTDFISEIDKRVSELGHFDWEIGPTKQNKFYLCISPNLDPEKLKTTKKIINLSIKCEGWDFLPSKPVKTDWKGIWKMTNDLGQEILVDSNQWKYVLFQFSDKTFDIDIMIDKVDGDLATCYLAVDIALTGYLGEEVFINLIRHIKIVEEFRDNDNKATSFKFIKGHLEQVSK